MNQSHQCRPGKGRICHKLTTDPSGKCHLHRMAAPQVVGRHSATITNLRPPSAVTPVALQEFDDEYEEQHDRVSIAIRNHWVEGDTYQTASNMARAGWGFPHAGLAEYTVSDIQSVIERGGYSNTGSNIADLADVLISEGISKQAQVIEMPTVSTQNWVYATV